MSRKFNANYAFVFYDINEKRVNKVFKVCKKYLEHYQYSVFRGPITPSNIRALKNEIQNIINPEEDRVSFILMMNDKAFGEIELGRKKADDDLFL
ncbi:CRISPR-associated endonuclease Cas2 [Caryophanon tenue]|uniref:CRISPR-associated endoribonuclease Cas2 n=1 Tax=Caryophanon tenue TaxID=33978 RepID=A0A1C0YHJ4_9BACL|nr:CRISPR-associated endonuclease Cas2 [Caryophanon tenue]OCS86658.1 CRISPR-associated endonuclease Cas2 [Caryophanon tenue]